MKKNKSQDMLKKYISLHSLENVFDENTLHLIELHHFDSGEMILLEDEIAKYFYLLVKGKARVSPSSEEGKFVLLDFMQPLDLLGDIEYIYKENNYHNVIALTDTTLIAIPMQLVDKYFSNNIYFYKLICYNMATKIKSTSIKYSRALLYPLKNRLAHYLYDLAHHNNTHVLKIKFTQTAEYFGITPRHFRRILVEFEKENILKRSEREIIILDIDGLKEYASYM